VADIEKISSSEYAIDGNLSRFTGMASTPGPVCHQSQPISTFETLPASEEGQQLYQRRAGVEGTLSQGVRAFGLRRTRYWGMAKTHLQHVAIAAAINIDRIVAWLDERPRAMTRISRFAALAPANADNPGEAAA